jgi:trans-aconitate 2-methyltransferase
MARSTTVWNPTQYLRFANERLRPALDLLAQVPLDAPGHVVDLGCGAGNVTVVLRQRFSGAEVLGIDGSATMLEKARATAPDCTFAQADIPTWQPQTAPDLIYSNAALQWVGEHDTLFPRLVSLLAPGGVLAVQIPAMHDAPIRTLQHDVAASGPWARDLHDLTEVARPIGTPEFYWDLLRPITASLDMWETIYLHAPTGEDAVVQWASGSSLRPFLDRLPEAQRDAFRAAYADAVRPHYPRRPDGTTLLPFRRLFLIARCNRG